MTKGQTKKTSTNKEGVHLYNLPRGHLHYEQYMKVIRSYQRFKQIDDGNQKGATFDGQTDDMNNFFTNCHHLKDWVIKDFLVEKTDPRYPKFCQLRDEVERLIDSHDCLKVCADICNGVKHLHREEKTRYPEPLRIRTEVHLDETLEYPPVKRVWKISSQSGKEWDAFELATECITVWTDFLNTHKNLFQQLLSN